MKRFWAVIAATLFLAETVSAEEKRLALLIGNADYSAEIGRLTNTIGDIGTMAAALESDRLGFEIYSHTNLDEEGFEDAIDGFEDAIQRESEAGHEVVAFFYYSGHGAATEVDGRQRNFLIPIGEDVTTPSRLIRDGIRLDEILQGFARSDAKAFFVASDACRNELAVSYTKTVGTKGFVPVAKRPGMLVAYATSEGATTPDDGLFAKVLAEEISVPGRETAFSFYRALARIAAQREIGSQPFLAPGLLPDGLCLAGCADASEVALRAEVAALRAQLNDLQVAVRRQTAGPGGENAALAESRNEAVANLVEGGTVEDLTALGEFAAGDVEAGLATLEASARQTEVEAEGSTDAAKKWRDVGALAYDREPLRALAAYREATRLAPDHFWSWIYVARLELSHGGDVIAARAATEQTVQVASIPQERSVAFDELGKVSREAGDLAGARAAYSDSLDITRDLLAGEPDSDFRKRNLSVVLNKVGDTALAEGDPISALAAYEEGLELAREIAEANPDSDEAWRDVSISLNKVGDVDQELGNIDAARTVQQESLGIRRRLAADNPESVQARRDVSISLEKMGDVEKDAGDLTAAQAAFQECLQIRRELAAENPQSARVWQDVTVALTRIGDVAQELGDLEGARVAFEESLVRRIELAEANPGSAQAHRSVWVAKWRLADLGGSSVSWADVVVELEDQEARGTLLPTDERWLIRARELAGVGTQ